MNEYAECCGKAKTATRECLHVLTEAGTPSRDRRQCEILYYSYTVAFTRYAQTSLALAYDVRRSPSSCSTRDCHDPSLRRRPGRQMLRR